MRVSKELKEFKQLLDNEDIEYLNENELDKYDLHMLIDDLNEKLFFLDDERDSSYIIHSLEEIIIMVILAILANCNTFVEIHLFICRHYNWLKKYLKLYDGIPSLSTIKRVIAIINPYELEKICNEVFVKFLDNFKLNLIENNDLIIKDIYSLDGKVCKKSERNTKTGYIRKTNAMSAYSVKNEMVVNTKFIGEKTNEIPTGIKLLEDLDIKNVAVTFDALNTHKEIIDYIVDNKAFYVAPIKENNKSYFNQLKEFFNDKELLKECSHINKKEKAHNQIEERKYYITNNINWIDGKEKWKQLKSILMVRRITNTSDDIRYYITNIDSKYFETIINIVRNEWSIENKLHWYLDVVFEEDKNKSYIKNTQKNLNIIRKFCLALIKKVKENYKLSLNSIRFCLNTDFENEIEHLLKML